jgi:hypothetical protein
MFSLDPATVGADGYREIFQAGEVFQGSRSSIDSIPTTCFHADGRNVDNDCVGFDRPRAVGRTVRRAGAWPRRVHPPRVRSVPLAAVTIGGVHNVFSKWGLEGGVGGGVTFHATPAQLQPDYGAHPASFQLFFRLRGSARIMKMP